MTPPLKVLHTGDTHVGYRQYGSDVRREDFLGAFEAVVDDAVEEDFDVFVHAGDLFHSRNPALVDVIPTVELFERLSDAGVRAFAVVGNHESKRDAQWIDLLESLGLVERLGLEPRFVGDVAFYGVDYVPKSRIESFEHDFQPSDASYSVMVAHGRFEPFPYGEWPLQEFVEEGPVDWDAFLLGDYHHHERREVGGVPAEYSGSTERASAEERESRGYNVVEFSEDGVSFTRRSLDHVTREFVFVEVDVSGVEGDATGYVVDRVLDHDVEDKAVVVYVEGDGDADVVRSEIETAVETEGALVVRTNDRREMEETEDTEIEVSFADPDDAVRERLQEMTLSEPAVEIDDVVRGDTVADTNLADDVESRVEDVVEEGWTPDTAELEPEDEPEENADVERVTEDEPEEKPDAEPGEEDVEHPPVDGTVEAEVTDVSGREGESGEVEAEGGEGREGESGEVEAGGSEEGTEETDEVQAEGSEGREGESREVEAEEEERTEEVAEVEVDGSEEEEGDEGSEAGGSSETHIEEDDLSEEDERVEEEFGTTLEEWT